MNLINETTRMDEQLDKFICYKVSLFKQDLVDQLGKLFNNNNDIKIKNENSIELRRSISKRKFSSSEDEEQDKLDSNNSNSNSFESNDKSDNEPMTINTLLNNYWSSKEDKTNDENLECTEKLNSSTNNHLHFNSSGSIEKNFNATIKCLNGQSIDLFGNIRLELIASTSQQTNSTSLTDNKLDLVNDNKSGDKSSKECLNDKDILTKNDQQKSSTSLSNSSPNSLSNNSSNDHNFIKTKLLSSVINKEIELECKENEILNSSCNNFNIDKIISDGKRTFSMFSSLPLSNNKDNKDTNSQLSNEQQLINQQLSASNDSSSSTLSAISVDTNQQPPKISFENVAQKSNIRRRSSDDSTTASACSEHDCLTPPSRKQFKKESPVDLTSCSTFQSPTTLNNLILSNSFNSLASINNQINLDFLPSYLSSSSLPQQQINELLSPIDQLKTKKTHLNRSANSKFNNDNKLLSPNNNLHPHYSKKLNHSPPKQTTNLNSFTASSINNSKPINVTNINSNNLIQNRKVTTENALNPETEKILKTFQGLAGNSLNGPSSYENLSMLANIYQNYGQNKLDPITTKIAKAAANYLNGGPVPDAQFLMNELTKTQAEKLKHIDSEFGILSNDNLRIYLDKTPEFVDTKPIIKRPAKLKLKDNGKLSYSMLENERISCFNVCGEPRKLNFLRNIYH